MWMWEATWWATSYSSAERIATNDWKKFKRALDNLVRAKHKLQVVFNANLHRAKRMRSEEENVIDDNVNE